MIMLEGANRMLSILEQTDQEEYDINQAMRDLNQAIHEIADEGEVTDFNEFAGFSIAADEFSGSDAWSVVPGRASLTDAIGVGGDQIGYIKNIWLDSSGATIPFKQVSVIELLNKYGDDEGQPEKYAVEGEYLYWRPVGAAGTSFTARILWSRVPPEYATGAEPPLMAKAPYACLYKACEIASVWTGDDQSLMKFEKMSARLINRYMIRNSMQGDGPREAEEYNG
jgi:hypothetical protein